MTSLFAGQVITLRTNGSGCPIGFGEVRGRVLPAGS